MNAGNHVSWPPASLRDNTDRILAECEAIEISGASSSNVNMDHFVVHMAALLYENDPIACRHLWRRQKDNPAARALLEPWYKIAALQLQHHLQAVWQELGTLMMSSSSAAASSAVSPYYATYAAEIAHSYRRHLLSGWMEKQATPPNYYASVLGFSQLSEMHEFLQQETTAAASRRHGRPGSSDKNNNNNKMLTDVVAFLESRV